MITLQQISIEEMSRVVGGENEACRFVGGAVGGGAGAVAGFVGAGPFAVSVQAGVNALIDAADRKPGTVVLDAAMGGAALVPGPVGAVGGAYTFGKGGANAADALCSILKRVGS